MIFANLHENAWDDTMMFSSHNKIPAQHAHALCIYPKTQVLYHFLNIKCATQLTTWLSFSFFSFLPFCSFSHSIKSKLVSIERLDRKSYASYLSLSHTKPLCLCKVQSYISLSLFESQASSIVGKAHFLHFSKVLHISLHFIISASFKQASLHY